MTEYVMTDDEWVPVTSDPDLDIPVIYEGDTDPEGEPGGDTAEQIRAYALSEQGMAEEISFEEEEIWDIPELEFRFVEPPVITYDLLI